MMKAPFEKMKTPKIKLGHCEPTESGPLPHTDLEQKLRHCERSAAVHAVQGHGLLHCSLS
jgi:hypothetical protein